MAQIPEMSAAAMGAGIAAGELSSSELLEGFVARNDELGGPINAVINTNVEPAAERAAAADEAAARGESWGPLHGVPMTLKDTWEFVGMTATAGAPVFADHQPATNADAVQRLLDAGAVVWGKTNTPLFAGDVQTYNDLFGTTNNPWDTDRTPGGSSGGSAAALAAGFTPLELGSDIGGSIRTPAHYCGVYGHKPTLEIVQLRGHIPGPPGTLAPSDLAVAGPMARTASDLALALDIVAGPALAEPPGWELNLPTPGFDSLKGLRVGIWYDDPSTPIAGDMADAFRTRADQLNDAGAHVTKTTLGGLTLHDFIDPYFRLLGPIVSAGMRAEILESMPQLAIDAQQRFEAGELKTPYAATQYDGVLVSHMDWGQLHEKRFKIRQKVIESFADFDVVLTPITPTPAPPHNQDLTFMERTISVDGADRAYLDQLNWIAPATMCGLPSTSAPIGMVDGLPINTQIIGTPYADHTTIAVAALMEEAFGGMATPPGFESQP